MQPAGTNRNASMWRSTSLVMLTVITLSLLAGAWVSARTLLAQYERNDRQRLSGIVGQFAPVLRTRLQLADALVRYLTAADTGADEDSLRRGLQRSESFV